MRHTAIRLMVRTIRAFGDHHGSDMAATVAFYGLLSLFPLILGLIALFGQFLPSDDVQKQLFDFLRRNVPGSVSFIQRNITHVISLRGATGALGIIVLFWSGSSMFGAACRAINRAWNIPHDRPFYLSKLRDVTMVLGIGVLLMLSLGLTTLFTVLGDPILPLRTLPFHIGPRGLQFLFTMVIFLLVYKFVPNTRVPWSSVLPGAITAAALTEIVKNLFIWYVRSFASYQSVYGSLASVIVLLVWIYISTIIIIIGAELSSQWAQLFKAARQPLTPAS